MHLPEPIPASVHDESFAGVTYHIRGELVPESPAAAAGAGGIAGALIGGLAGR